jgi:hypothetical protein
MTGAAFNYMYSFLDFLGKPNKPDILIDFSVFQESIRRAFDDPDPRQTEETALRVLR